MPFSRLCTNTATLGTRTEVEIDDCHFAFSDPLDPGLFTPVLLQEGGSFERLCRVRMKLASYSPGNVAFN